MPMAEIRRFLRKGAIIEDPAEPERKLCIYREPDGEFYTVVFQEFREDTVIVTGWPSKEWEKNAFERVKRNEVPKV